MLQCSNAPQQRMTRNPPPHKEIHMSYVTPEQMMVAQKAQVETLFGLSQKAFEGVEKLVELNLQVARTALDEAADAAKAALSVKDAQELLALQQSLLSPAAEKAASYSRHLYDIAAATNAEVAKVAEEQMADTQKKFMSMVDSAVKSAPAGSENAMTMVKSAVAAANNAFESVQKASKQAADMVNANVQAMASTAVQAAQPAPRAKRAA